MQTRNSKNNRITRFVALILSLVLLIVATLCGCVATDAGSAGSAAGGRGGAGQSDGITVLTSVFAPYDFVRQISEGTDIDVRMLLKPGEEVHSFDPTMKDIVDISGCDLFIYTGGENDAWVEDILSSSETEVRTLRMIEQVSLIEEEIQEHMTSAEKGGEEDAEETEWDEHVWTSPANAIDIVSAISEELKALDPEEADIIASNTLKYTDQLKALDADFKEAVAAGSRKTMIFADRFPVRYFTEEFGLDYYAAFPGCSADAEASAATVAFLIDKVRADHIPVVFYIEMSDERMADTVCEATGAKKLEFHSCHNITADEYASGATYISIMRQNLNNLKAALA